MLRVRFLIFLFILFLRHVDAEENMGKYLFQFLENFTHQIEIDLNLKCCGKSGDLKKKIVEIRIHLSARRRATIEEARGLHVYVMEKLIQTINEDKELTPYFFEDPFTFKRIEITIDFNEPKFGIYYDGTVTRVRNNNDLALGNQNKIFYSAEDPFTDNIYKLLVEPYEEAVRLTKTSPLKFPYIHRTTEQELEIDRIFEFTVVELNKQHGLYVINIGGKMTKGIEEIGAKLRFFEPVTIEKARHLEFLVINQLLNSFNQNEILRKYLREYPFPPNRVKISIEFKKKTGAPYYNGSIR